MRRFKLYSALPLSLIFVVGCSTQEYEAEQARKAQQTAQQTERLALPHGPPGKVLKQALEQLELRPEQRQVVEQIHLNIRSQVATLASEHAALVQELLTTVRTSSADRPELKQAFRRNVRGLMAMKPTFIASLNQLHATLDPAQRAKLVQILEEHHDKHRQRVKQGECGHFGKRFGKRLGISDAQRQQLRQLMLASLTPEERAEMKQRREERWQRHKAALEAFKSDTFDAAKLPVFNRPHPKHLKAERVVRFLNVALPIFTPAQRAQVAQMIEARSKAFVESIKVEPAAATAR